MNSRRILVDEKAIMGTSESFDTNSGGVVKIEFKNG
jgi:hypothetical protein